MRFATKAALVCLTLFSLACVSLLWLTRRALPTIDGVRQVEGLGQSVEILRDRWGVPHVFAQDDDGASSGLGYAHVQDRLFQMEVLRHLSQGRLAELLGPAALDADRLFRTLDLHGIGRRMLARSRPEARAGAEAYARGANAARAEVLRGHLPLELTLLGHEPEPFAVDDFVGVVGYMAWTLQIAYQFDPIYEDLIAKLGPEPTAELFPYNRGANPPTYPMEPAANRPAMAVAATKAAATDLGSATHRAVPGRQAALASTLLSLSREAEELVRLAGDPRASNNWVVAPRKSQTGHALLANDPHLSHGVPGIWYQAHLQSPNLDVVGVTLPGLPFVAIGHNRRIAWGFTNLMLDAGDFFVETFDPANPKHVMFEGRSVPIEERKEILHVRGGSDLELVVRRTPHGPLVSELMPERGQALSFRWVFDAALHANEVNGFWELNRATDWGSFRKALSWFGAVAQNVVYADVEGHIGMQASGAVPRFRGPQEGTLFRRGDDGSQEWDGFWPFEDNPVVFDPPQGFLASANSPSLEAPSRYYISSQWEPFDRFERIREVLTSKEKLSPEDLQKLHVDTVWITARELTPQILSAFEAQPSTNPLVRAALLQLADFRGDMRTAQAAPTIFAAFYKRLFYEMFEDEMGPELAKAYRSRANLSALMLRSVLKDGHTRFVDRVNTQAVEGLPEILRASFEKGVADLHADLGDSPARWLWGQVHTLTLTHPLARASRLLASYFNLGPVSMPGQNSTVAKAEYREGSYEVLHGPSMRQLTNLGDLSRSWSVIPAGQSGIPSSPHYGDLLPLWAKGEYIELLLNRPEVEKAREGVLVLEPR